MHDSIEVHEAANIFPLDEENIAELVKDIAAHGLQVRIELLDGKIIDGRRRYMACDMAGVEPLFRDIETDDPVAYVISLNLHRRHLTPGQRAMVAGRAREMYDRQAKERMNAGQQAGGRGHKKNSPANLPDSLKGDARDQVGKVFNVSGRSVDYAKKVLTEAHPDVVKAVDEGRMAVSTAAILASESEEKQRAEANKPKRQRDYRSVSAPVGNGELAEGEVPNEDEEKSGKVKGVGVIRAHEAINCLSRIPKNDALRSRGFQVVTDWIRRNR